MSSLAQENNANLSAAQPLTTSATVVADTTVGIHRVWFIAGLGLGSEKLAFVSGLTFVIGQKNQENQNVLTLRAAVTGSISISGDGSSHNSQGDFGLL